MNEANFHIQTIALTPDQQGENVATLLAYKPSLQHSKAVLYIHGFIDYFFHEHVAEFFHAQGYAFYAIDLRKYGRSIRPHQLPNHTHNIKEYYEELTIAVNQIKAKHSYLILLGHSTGGLIAPLFVAETEAGKQIDALILNSPFFDLNYSPILKKTILPLLLFVAKQFPNANIYAKLTSLYGKSLHQNYEGEWNYNLNYKPITGFNITAGWLRAIHQAQSRLKSGLQLKIPTLVLHSSKSINRLFTYCSDMQKADAVLNVKSMKTYAPFVSKNLSLIEVENAMHDVFLSTQKVRKNAFEQTKTWLDKLKT